MFDLFGTVRIARPDDTIYRAMSVRRQLGITRVANITGLDSIGIPVWVSIRPLARSLSVSQGKGITNELAKASALMESIEVAHAEDSLPIGVTAPLMAYRQDKRFIHPHELPFRAGAEESNTDLIQWSLAREVKSNLEKFIPTELFNLDFTRKNLGTTPFHTSTNGLASGNSIDEAILHGLCELIERDQISFWMIKSQLQKENPATQLDLATINDSTAKSLISACQESGLRCHVWWVSTNLEVPAFGALIADVEEQTLYPIRASGHGCHPLKKVALCRAITEAIQSRLTFISGSRDDVTWMAYKKQFPVSTSSNSEWLSKINSEETSLDYNELPDYSGPVEMRTMLDWVLQRIAAAGLPEPSFVDLTRPEVKIPVVYVCVPGLENQVSVKGYMPGNRMKAFYSTFKEQE